MAASAAFCGKFDVGQGKLDPTSTVVQVTSHTSNIYRAEHGSVMQPACCMHDLKSMKRRDMYECDNVVIGRAGDWKA